MSRFLSCPVSRTELHGHGIRTLVVSVFGCSRWGWCYASTGMVLRLNRDGVTSQQGWFYVSTWMIVRVGKCEETAPIVDPCASFRSKTFRPVLAQQHGDATNWKTVLEDGFTALFRCRLWPVTTAAMRALEVNRHTLRGRGVEAGLFCGSPTATVPAAVILGGFVAASAGVRSIPPACPPLFSHYHSRQGRSLPTR